jgi:Raf kinase inhibitor-like YbhB/YbcL family protein
MKIASTGIDAKGNILADYTADGKNINPPVTFSEIPDGVQSLILMMDDSDAPEGRFIHWLLYDMPASTLQIVEGENPAGAKVGTNDFGQQGYGGPKPPSGTHHYHIRLIALDTMLDLPDGATHEEVEQAMDGHVIGFRELIGTYSAK